MTSKLKEEDLDLVVHDDYASDDEHDAFLADEDRTSRDASRPLNMRSLSLDFDMLPTMPLSLSAGTPLSASRAAPTEKSVTWLNGFALVVGLQIGSGIFSSPGPVAGNAGSVGASLIVWLVSGLLAWTGAASYAELGAAIPLNGGPHAYLLNSWGPLAAYLFIWTAITALKPGSGAIIAVIFAEYVNRLIYHAISDASGNDASNSVPQWSIKITAILVVAIIAALNALSNRLSANTQVVFLVLKLVALVAIAVFGIISLVKGSQTDNFSGNIFEGSSTSIGSYALALYSGLWAFDGWDNVNYVTAEMKNPKRDLPRVLHSAIFTVTIAYILANVAYYAVLPTAVIKQTNTIALDFGRAILGPVGGTVFALCVACSCFGALNASFFTSGRLIYVAAREGYIPKWFAKIHPKRDTPVNALVLQAVLTSIMILSGTFESLVNFYGVCSWIFYFMAVFGLVILRVKEPRLERPYRVFIATPIIFCCVAVFLLAMPIIAAPFESLAAVAFIALGFPLYYLGQAANSKSRSSTWLGRLVDNVLNVVGSLHDRLSNLRSYKGEVIEMEES